MLATVCFLKAPQRLDISLDACVCMCVCVCVRHLCMHESVRTCECCAGRTALGMSREGSQGGGAVVTEEEESPGPCQGAG